MIPALIIRADAGGTQGTGHVMRMLALAQAYQNRGGSVVIASVQCPAPVVERIQELGIEHHLFSHCELGDAQDAEATLKLGADVGATWIVLDGYHFTEDYQKSFANQEAKLLVIDDYGHCQNWHCNAVLNQNLGAEHWKHGESDNPNTQWLLGSSYALIRSEFLPSIQAAKEKTSPARRVVVTMGGADTDNVTLMVLQALETISIEGLEVRVLVGGANLNRESLEEFVKTSQHSIELLGNVRDMPAIYEWADAIISAGGSTCWEWLAYGLPGAVVTIADNQEPVVAELTSQNLALSLGWFTQFNQASWSQALAAWLNGESSHASFTERRHTIDGYGAARVAALLSDNGLWCRPAKTDDARLYFDWANDPVVRASGFHTSELVWENHCAWFEKMIHDPASYLFVVSNAMDQKTGQVRLTTDPSGFLEIGFSVDAKHRGMGIGDRMLEHVLDHVCREQKQIKGFLARVKMVNKPSAKIFTNQGFERIEDDPEHGCLVYLKKTQP